MKMSRKGDIFVEKIGFDHGKQIPAPHGLQFFGGSEPAVVPHDSAHKARTEKHVRPFQQDYLSPLFYGTDRCGTPGPSAADNNNPHILISVWIICVRLEDLLF
jgi:hypothetical protein